MPADSLIPLPDSMRNMIRSSSSHVRKWSMHEDKVFMHFADGRCHLYSEVPVRWLRMLADSDFDQSVVDLYIHKTNSGILPRNLQIVDPVSAVFDIASLNGSYKRGIFQIMTEIGVEGHPGDLIEDLPSSVLKWQKAIPLMSPEELCELENMLSETNALIPLIKEALAEFELVL